jgi:hypothetical protein
MTLQWSTTPSSAPNGSLAAGRRELGDRELESVAGGKGDPGYVSGPRRSFYRGPRGTEVYRGRFVTAASGPRD